MSASTQNQALAALLFLYKEVLSEEGAKELPWLNHVVRAKRWARLPVVLTRQGVQQLLAALDPYATSGLVVRLLYGTGMRLMEGLRLRVKDVDLSRREIIVREGKGNKDQVTMLPEALVEPLRRQLEMRREMYDADRSAGRGTDVFLPDALSVKYRNAASDWVWQYVFSASGYS